MSHGRIAFAWAGGAVFAASLLYVLYFYFVELGRPAAATGSLQPLIVDVFLFAVFAMHHSFMARPRAKAWLTAIAPPELERATFVWSASILLVLACLLWQRIGGVIYSAGNPWRWLLSLVQLAGIYLTIHASGRLDVLELAGIRQARDQPRTRATGTVGLQMSGPYKIVRHPVYLGWVLMVFAAPHMTADRLAFAVITTAYLIVGTAFEERSLEAAFGESYREYRKRVRWRFLPGVY